MGAFLKRIPADFRAARRSAALGLAVRSHGRETAKRSEELTAALRALGAAAEAAPDQVESPAAQSVAATRQRLGEFEAAREEKRTAFKAARDHLSAEQKAHTDLIHDREAEYEPLAQALRDAFATVGELDRKIAAAGSSLARLQTELAQAESAQAAAQAAPPAEPGAPAPPPAPAPTRPPEQVRGEIAALEAEREAAQREVQLVRQRHVEVQAAVDAKAAELKATRDVWEKRKHELADVLQAAEAARSAAETAAQAAQAALAEAHLALGKALYESGCAADALAEPMGKARELAAALASLEQQIAAKQTERTALQVAARRFALTATVALVLVILIVLLLVWIF
jgi:DNA repair exonuclease SbcCD ATPase subunit